jgi:hypothetical protein
VTSSWTARYPDLTGKAAIVAGKSPRITEVVRGLAANGTLLAIVSGDRDTVDDAVAVAESLDVAVLGMTADPSSAAVWERIAPHIEQRLGPIDVVVVLGEQTMRDVVRAAVLPDMTARHRGVLVEVDDSASVITTSGGVRHRAIDIAADTAHSDIAATVLLCASDTVAAASLAIKLN